MKDAFILASSVIQVELVTYIQYTIWFCIDIVYIGLLSFPNVNHIIW